MEKWMVWSLEFCSNQFSCLSFINHVITNAYYVIISVHFPVLALLLFFCSFLFPVIQRDLRSKSFNRTLSICSEQSCVHTNKQKEKKEVQNKANYVETFDMWNISLFCSHQGKITWNFHFNYIKLLKQN